MRLPSLVALLLLGGCVSTGTQVKDSALTQFQKGVTTETDVERALGPPTSTTMSSDGARFISYAGVHAQAKAASFIPVIGLFAGGASSQVSVVTFRFGQDGKLLDYTSTQSNTSATNGLAAGYQTPAHDPSVVK